MEIRNINKKEKARRFIPKETATLGSSEWNIVLVGAGGTGSYVAHHLVRMMATRSLVSKRIKSLTIIDGDLVEMKNVARQDFYPDDVGKPKARVIAKRLALRYKIPVSYKATILRGIKDTGEGTIPKSKLIEPLLMIGAVDNALARKAILKVCEHNQGSRNAAYWIDAGNGYQRGQVAWGNTSSLKRIHKDMEREWIEFVPYPSIVFPNLIEEKRDIDSGASCAEAIERETQGPVINAQMGVLVAEMVKKMLTGELDIHYSIVDYATWKMVRQPLTKEWVLEVSKRISQGN